MYPSTRHSLIQAQKQQNKISKHRETWSHVSAIGRILFAAHSCQIWMPYSVVTVVLPAGMQAVARKFSLLSHYSEYPLCQTVNHQNISDASDWSKCHVIRNKSFMTHLSGITWFNAWLEHDITSTIIAHWSILVQCIKLYVITFTYITFGFNFFV